MNLPELAWYEYYEDVRPTLIEMSYLVFADVQALHIQTTALYSLALLLVWPQNDIGPYTSSALNINLSSF